METLTWLFFVLSFTVGAYLSYRVTKWYYKRKIKNTYYDSSKSFNRL